MLLSNCYLYNYHVSHPVENDAEAFVLKTCQRQLMISLKKKRNNNDKFFSEKDAYQFFLSTICGLESPLIGETEIVAQAKEAYLHYLKSPHRHRDIQKFIEKAFHDAKIIRTKFLNSFSQKPYAYLVRKFLEPYQESPVILLGSGVLAKDILAQTVKKFPMHLWARNKNRIEELKSQFSFNILDSFSSYRNFPIVINTISSQETLFTSSDLEEWNKKGLFFLDLTNPSCRDEDFKNDKVMSFEQFLVFIKNTIQQNEKKVDEAKKAIESFARKRYFHIDV